MPRPALPTVAEGSADTQKNLSLVEDSSFRSALHSHLRNTYEPLEQWYLRISIEKAHQIDEPDLAARPVVSSALDDTFYILKKIISRILSTSNVHTLDAMCKAIRTILERDFAQALRRRMEGTFANLSQGRTEEKDRKERDARSTYIVRLTFRADSEPAANLSS